LNDVGNLKSISLGTFIKAFGQVLGERATVKISSMDYEGKKPKVMHTVYN
jgi:hypothetical protein